MGSGGDRFSAEEDLDSTYVSGVSFFIDPKGKLDTGYAGQDLAKKSSNHREQCP